MQPSSVLARRLVLLQQIEALGEALLNGSGELEQVQHWLHDREALLAQFEPQSQWVPDGQDLQDAALRGALQEAALLIGRISAQDRAIENILESERDAVAGALRRRREQTQRNHEPRLVSRRA